MEINFLTKMKPLFSKTRTISSYSAALILGGLLVANLVFGWVNPTLSPPDEGLGPVFVSSSGNVGIGNPPDPSYKLDVSGTFRNTDSAILATAAGSRVGIGTISPASKLHLVDGNFLQNNPVNPTARGGSGLTNMPVGAGVLRVKVVGRYAYVTFVGTGSNAFRIIDVYDPNAPQVVGGQTITGFPAAGGAVDVAVAGRYAYITFNSSQSNAFRIVDVSNPSAPQVVGGSTLISNMPLANAVSVFVRGNYAYVTFDQPGMNAFRIIDISNPSSPKVVGGQSLSFPVRGTFGIYVAGKYAYVNLNCSSIVNCAGGTESLRIINVSDPGNPQIVGMAVSGAMPNVPPIDIYVSGRYAYLSFAGQTTAAFRVIDVADPASPQAVGGTAAFNTNTPIAQAFSITGAGRYAFVGFSGPDNNSLRIVDIANPANPIAVGGHNLTNVPAGNGGIAVAGRYAYMVFNVAAPSDMFRIIEIPGLEGVSASLHSLEAGSLQVRENALIKDQLNVGSLTVGSGILTNGRLGLKADFTISNSAGAGGIKIFTKFGAGGADTDCNTVCGDSDACKAAFFSTGELAGSPTGCADTNSNRRCLCFGFGN